MCNLQCGEFINTPGVTKLVQLEPNASVGLWAVDLATIDTPACQHCLSPVEWERATRFICTQNRTNYLAAHIALRYLMAHVTGIEPQTLAFTQGPFGKPAVSVAPPCFFNLSHSGSRALVGISHGSAATEIGVDIEVLRPLEDMQALATQVLTPLEQAELRRLPLHDQNTALLRCWTRKEACLKAWGCGLQVEPKDVPTGLGQAAQSTTVRHQLQASPVLVRTYLQHTQFVASVAVTTK